MIASLVMVWALVAGLRAPSCWRSLCPPHGLGPLGALLRMYVLSLPLSSTSRFPFSSAPKTKYSLHLGVLIRGRPGTGIAYTYYS